MAITRSFCTLPFQKDLEGFPSPSSVVPHSLAAWILTPHVLTSPLSSREFPQHRGGCGKLKYSDLSVHCLFR